jgi:hypothetical protein
MKQLKFVAACKDYFGFLPNQSLGEFLAEVKQLTDKDRSDLKIMFLSVGYEIVE